MQDKIKQSCQTIRDLILQDKIKHALEELNKLTVLFQNKLLTDEAILLAGKHKKLVKEISEGILTYEQQQVSINRLRKTILEFIQAVEKEDITSDLLLSIFRQSYQKFNETVIINQQHYGSGDNIAGDKITNIKIPFKPLLFLTLLSLSFLVGYKNQSIIKHIFGWDKIFFTNDSRFKVLIVPFKVMCNFDRNKDIGLHIKERLVELNIKDTLNIYPYYLDIAISKNFNGDSAKYLQQYHNADQIIYGSYYDEKCSKTDGDEICYNWITDKKWDLEALQSNILPNSNFQIATVQDLREGKIQGKTDYIIYWLAGLTAYKQFHYSKGLKHFTYLYEDLKFTNHSLLNQIGLIHFKLSDYQKAHDFFNKSLFLSQEKQDLYTSFSNLATVYMALEDYEQGRDLLKVALELVIANPEQNPSISANINRLVRVYRFLENYEQAKDLLKVALEMDISKYGERHYKTMSRRMKLLSIFEALGDDDARDSLKKTIDISIISKHFTDQPPEKYEQQLKRFENAWSIPSKNVSRFMEAIHYKNHDTMDSLRRTVGLSTLIQDLKEYLPKRFEMERKWSNLLNYSKTKSKRSKLAMIYYDLGEKNKTKLLFNEVYHIFESLLGKSHPNTKTVGGWLNRM